MIKIMTKRDYAKALDNSYRMGYNDGRVDIHKNVEQKAINKCIEIVSKHSEYTRRNTIAKSLRNLLMKAEQCK